MKTKMIAAGTGLSIAVLSWLVPSIFAGHGSGGFSGGMHGGAGGHSYSTGAAYSGGLHAYGSGMRYSATAMHNYYMRGYTGNMRMYSNARMNRLHGNYTSNYPSRNFNGYHVYNSHPVNRASVNAGRYGTLNYSNQAANRRVNVSPANPRNVDNHAGNDHPGNWARNNPRNHFDQQTQNHLRHDTAHTSSWSEAHHNHDEWGHNHHDHDWWHHHCDTIIFVNWGWWGWWDGWWYPCWGYDPYYSNYLYDGPIYGYDGLPPDEVVANVQDELQQLGYYFGEINGVLNPTTHDALIRFQRDHGLPVTGAVDQDTIGALGLG